ncbi:MAG: hypothetical protein Q9174_003117 [Haloplaca sp. 1 TL-2023]
MDKWGPGWIPQWCKDTAKERNFNPADITTWNVHYDDCKEPWIMCHHKSSPSPILNLVDTFGRLPVKTRQYVRHIITLPAENGWAYNANGNIAFFGTTLTNLNVHLHESAHSLDLQNAYKDKPLHSSQKWLSEYAQDSKVPDPYAQTNQIENVAQNTVITAYERNVPNGFHGINKDSKSIFHQWATVDTEQREAGKLLIPGGKCGPRLKNSDPVKISGVAMRIQAQMLLEQKPDVSLSAETEVLPDVEYSTLNSCAEMFFKHLDGDENGVEVMEDVEFSTEKSDWEAFNLDAVKEAEDAGTEEL